MLIELVELDRGDFAEEAEVEEEDLSLSDEKREEKNPVFDEEVGVVAEEDVLVEEEAEVEVEEEEEEEEEETEETVEDAYGCNIAKS